MIRVNFKRCFLVLFTIFVCLLFADNVNAAKVVNGKVTIMGESKDVSEFERYVSTLNSGKTISEVCLYLQSDKSSEDKGKYLLIFSDGSANVGWEDGGCDVGSSDGKCTDGVKKDNNKIAGLKNWSKNSSGVARKIDDAYEAYVKNGYCPPYMTQKNEWGANYFYLSTGGSATDLAAIKRKASEYTYYNAGETLDINADISCAYTDDEDAEDGAQTIFTLNFSNDGKVTADYTKDVKFHGNDGDRQLIKLDLNPFVTSKTYLKMIKNGMCPKTVDACEYGHMSFWFWDWYNGAVNNWVDIRVFGDGTVNKDAFCGSDDSVNFYCTGDNCSDDDICIIYDDYKNEIQQTISGYKSAKNASEKKAIMDEYNKLKEDLNGFCTSALGTLNYAEGNCVSQCIKLTKDIADWEIEAGIRTPGGNDKCNIGIAIVTMVYNVLKWAKYIVPALIIVLSILDFIKAMASQSDDEMKKAQGKFIKRLIIAILLFLLPLIINFLLKTFGMYSSKCDITDLFS